jgi:hypothetical protein
VAKQNKTPDQEGEVTFQFFKISIKGSDTSIQKGLDTIAATLVQAGMVQLPPTRQVRPATRQIANEPDQSDDDGAGDTDFVESDEVEPTASTAAAPKKQPEKRWQPNYKVINDINPDDVSPTLSDFMAQHPPETTFEKYLAIAYWYKHVRGLEEFTVAHFFTAYKLLKWVPPVDPSQPVRDLRSKKRQWLTPGSKQGYSTIKNLGEGMVLKFGKAAV